MLLSLFSRKARQVARSRKVLSELLSDAGGSPPTRAGMGEDSALIGGLAAYLITELLEISGESWVTMTLEQKAKALGMGIILCDAWTQLLEIQFQGAARLMCIDVASRLIPTGAKDFEKVFALSVQVLEGGAFSAFEQLQDFHLDVASSIGTTAQTLVARPEKRDEILAVIVPVFALVMYGPLAR